MKSKKCLFFAIVLIGMFNVLRADENYVQKALKVNHPRILLLQGEEKLIQANVEKNVSLAKVHEAILSVCNQTIEKPVLERKLEGIRLLDVSREALKRIFYLSYAFRMTGDIQYAQRAEKELIAVSQFSDWNPSHFLDVAEMALGVAIGYDWLYDFLQDDSKIIIETALLTKAVEPALNPKYLHRFNNPTNWSQVCNAGIMYAALALAEKQPVISQKLIDRSLTYVAIPMKNYDPDGAFAEGYMYWGYGTAFNVLLLDAAKRVGIDVLKLQDFSGFSKTPYYLQHMVGTSGQSFNYMDCIPNSILNASQFWFASQLKDPSLLWVEKSYLEKDNFVTLTDGNGLPLSGEQARENKYSQFTKDRTLPALMIWGKNIDLSQVTAPMTTCFGGKGETPVSLMRTSWTDKNAIYLGFKTGSAGSNHGHMDVGSFVIDAVGERWASDFGMQNYNSLESKGINLWNLAQNSDRWNVFRYNNLAHNTLAVNGQYQQVKGKAGVDKHGFAPGFMFAVSDLSEVYEGQLKSIKRGVAIVAEKFVVVQDELESKATRDTLRWTALTEATVKIRNKSTVELTLHGKKILVNFDTSSPITIKTWSTKSPNEYDAPNDGKTLFGFEMVLKPNSKQTVCAKFIPSSEELKSTKFKRTLLEWK
jgi:hypothetical protein